MKARTKPLSMFLEDRPGELEYFPEQEFDALVAEGKLVKHVQFMTWPAPNGEPCRLRLVLYALHDEAWRIPAMLLVRDLYDTLVPGWRPDLERVIGALLGYPRESTERM